MNQRIRAWYLREVGKIRELKWIQEGHDLESRARRALKIRNNARRKARSMMENPVEVEQLRRRDLQVYGNPDGPTFEQFVAENVRRGLEGDQIYERIIGGAQTIDEDVNRQLRAKPPGDP